MTTPSDPTATAEVVLRTLCWPPTPDQRHLPDWPLRDQRTGLGELIETAILHKVFCLLADRLMTTGAESSLYGGSGARRFTDLDVLLAPEHTTLAHTILTDLGYHSSAPQATAFTRHVEDILVPRITIDLTPSTHHASGEHDVRDILSRRGWQPLPGHDQELPVLAAPDALLHCLARLERTTRTPPRAGTPRWARRADALRLARTCENSSALLVPATAMAGWARPQHIWPQLSLTPFSAGNKR